MHIFKNPLAFLLALGAAAHNNHDYLPLCPQHPASPKVQAAIFDDFVQSFYVEKNATGALSRHIAEDYIQHNTGFLSGRQNAIDGLGGFISFVNFTIVHRAFENNTGWIHYRLDVPGQNLTAVVDVFRFNGTCIMEHWDVIQVLSGNAINPLALF